MQTQTVPAALQVSPVCKATCSMAISLMLTQNMMYAGEHPPQPAAVQEGEQGHQQSMARGTSRQTFYDCPGQPIGRHKASAAITEQVLFTAPRLRMPAGACPSCPHKLCTLPHDIIGLAIAASWFACRSYRDRAYLKPVTGPHVWKAADFAPIEDHATWFTEEDLVELRAAVQQAIATGKELKVSSLSRLYRCQEVPPQLSVQKSGTPLWWLMAAEGALPQPLPWPLPELLHDCACGTFS